MKWIKCSDRMPDLPFDALILVWVGDDWELVFYDKDCHAYDSPNAGWIDESIVTHWSPLPVSPDNE